MNLNYSMLPQMGWDMFDDIDAGLTAPQPQSNFFLDNGRQNMFPPVNSLYNTTNHFSSRNNSHQGEVFGTSRPAMINTQINSQFLNPLTYNYSELPTPTTTLPSVATPTTAAPVRPNGGNLQHTEPAISISSEDDDHEQGSDDNDDDDGDGRADEVGEYFV